MGTAALCLITALSVHFIYNTSLELLPDKKKAARIVPLLHAIYATFSSIYVIYHHSPIMDAPTTICEAVGPSQYIFTISLGYFLWDLFICIKENWGIDWKIHAIFCVAMYGIAVCTHSLYRWGIFALFYEFSTIFLHFYIFLFYYGLETMANGVKIIFGLSFFFCRIIVGSFVTKECIEAYLGFKPIEFGCIGDGIFAFVIIVNLLFHVLNLYWFWLIVSAAIWGKTKKNPSKKKKKSTPKDFRSKEFKTAEITKNK